MLCPHKPQDGAGTILAGQDLASQIIFIKNTQPVTAV